MIQPESTIGIIIVALLGSASLGFFLWGIYLRYQLLQMGRKEGRLDHLPRRLIALVPLVFGQWTLLKGAKASDRAGITHLFIFWGGIAFIPGYVFFVFGPAFSDNFAVNVLGRGGATALSFAADALGVLALICIIWGLVRRFVLRPERQTASSAWLYFSLTILALLLGYFGMEALRIIMSGYPIPALQYPAGKPLANALISLGISGNQVQPWHDALWWFEFTVIVVFMIHSRYSEHMHAIAAPINFLFRSLEPRGALKPIDEETARLFAAPAVKNLTWKELLDGLTCTECGRCQIACPAYLTGKVLNPKQIIQKIRKQLFNTGQVLLRGGADGDEPVFGEGGDSISEEAVWDCTTCRACQQHCPVAIEHVDSLIDLRRQLVERGYISGDIRNTLENIKALGNPWGQSQVARSDLGRQLQLPPLREKGEAYFLYWIGCASVYDDRARNITRAVSSLLNKAGVKYFILGAEEKCCGDPSRRLGEEGLFQQIASANMETFKKYDIHRIITHCPHCYNTFKNEYPQFGAQLEVVHHSELILDLIRNGKITLTRPLDYRLTFHDPCYLGRYNDLYDPPRQVIQANHKLKLVEMKNRREESFCCGAGGGHFWMAGGRGQRMENVRLEEARETGSRVIATACPYCAAMFDAAAATMQTPIKVMDIAELVMESAV